MMAFCSALERIRINTRSNGLSCARSRLPANLKATSRKKYTVSARATFSSSGTPIVSMSVIIARASCAYCLESSRLAKAS